MYDAQQHGFSTNVKPSDSSNCVPKSGLMNLDHHALLGNNCERKLFGDKESEYQSEDYVLYTLMKKKVNFSDPSVVHDRASAPQIMNVNTNLSQMGNSSNANPSSICYNFYNFAITNLCLDNKNMYGCKSK